MSHTHTQLMPRKNMLMAPVLIKRKCLFKMCCTKAGTPSCMMILSPRLSPVLGLLKRRKTSNRLRGRELPPGTIPRSDLHFTCNGYTGRIWCRYALSGSVLKGQFLPGSTEQRQEDRASRGESSENVHLRSSQFTGPPSETALPQRRGVVRYCGSPLPTTILFCVISKNSINNFFLTLGLPFLTPPPPIPYGGHSFGSLPNIWQPLHTNLSARKRQTEKSFLWGFLLLFFCLHSRQRGR